MMHSSHETRNRAKSRGRPFPNTYQSDYCETVKTFKTIKEFAKSIGKTRACVYLWCKKYPEFRDACNVVVFQMDFKRCKK